MSSLLTNKGRALILNGSVDMLTDTIKVMLLGTGVTPSVDDNFVSDVVSGELSGGTGYTGGFGGSGRKTLASKTVTEDDTNDVARFDAADVTYTAINSGTVAHAAIIKEVTNNGDSPVIGYVLINPNVATNGGDLVLQWAALGIFEW